MKKKLTMAAAATVVAMTLAACSDPTAGPAGSDDAGDVTWPEATADLTGTQLTLWAAQASAGIPVAVIDAFEEATGATVNVVTVPDPYEQGIQTRVATGDMPDLAFWQPTASMLTALNAPTNLQPLDDAPWLADMDPAVRDVTGILDGTRYAALISSPTVQGVFYNKAVFAEHGIETPANWDELVEAARTLNAAGQTAFFDFLSPTGWATQWAVQVQLADAAADGLWDRINAGDEAFTDETFLTAIENYKAMIDEGLFNTSIASATFEDQAAALLSGEAAMAFQINALLGAMQAQASAEEVDDAVGFFPISPSGNVATVSPDQTNGVVAFRTGDADREAASRQFLSFWLGEGYETFIQDQATVSLLNSVETPDSVPQVTRDLAAAVANSVGSMQAQAIVNPDLFLFLSNMAQGALTPQQAAQNTQDHFVQLARALGADGF
ncbi:carbohydrate ABC transporter substrate-binding protein [Xylanimonas allomyrinae]|uniref:Carbohydrate ABC transporter substrate-binding protein n=1 Tax=Xylanimonas allomyrinae TaxID=2509459 RepID=A0A4V0YEH0_9MICO|nr:ABC transporter substrate-binding protein [Xylanimonas allomyrinae]QAY64181.1 carbohydrate ABC transporter substrate-binding protein [Xylanimonas allomyrinae]